MQTTKQTNRSTLAAEPLMLAEELFTTPQGDLVRTIYVDLAGWRRPEELSLAKISEPQFGLGTADSVRLSRPSVFQGLRDVQRVRRAEGVPVRHARDSARGRQRVRSAGVRDAEGLFVTGQVSPWFGRRSGDNDREFIHPMTVLRRLDVVLEDTKQAVLDMKTNLDEIGVVEQDLRLPSRSCPVEGPPSIDNSRGCRYGRANGTHHLTRPCHPDTRILGELHHGPTPRDCRGGGNQSRH